MALTAVSCCTCHPSTRGEIKTIYKSGKKEKPWTVLDEFGHK